MQNTILIHAPGRRQGRGALVLAYTALFALLMGIWAAIFALNGQSFIQYGDTLKQHYPFLVYYGRWLRQAARCVLTGAAVPTWDFSIGYGADIITTLSYYGLGDPLDLLAAFVPGRWTEQLLEGLIVLRLYLAGLAFMAFSRRHGNSRFGTLLGALAYVFSAWPIQAGLIEPVFLVPMYCFPLMLLGADDLFEGRSPVLYIAAIALTALSNFLFFYMAAVLLVLYAIAVYSKRYGAKNLRTLPPLLAKFIGFALVGIAISAVTLLPTAQELFGSARFGLTRETAPYPFYRFFELLANMTTGMGYDAYSTYAGVTSAAFLGVLVLFAKPRQNTVLKCAWLGLLALLLVPQAGSVLNGISYVSNRWVWAFTMLEAFILARVCPGITAFEPKEKRNLFALLAVYCVVAFCVKQGRTETALLGALLLVLLAVFVLAADGVSCRGVQAVLLAGCCLGVVMNLGGYYGIEEADAVNEYRPAGYAWSTTVQDNPAVTLHLMEDQSYWRYDSLVNEPINSPMLLDVYGTGYFFSLNNSYLSSLFRELGQNTPVEYDYRGLQNRTPLETLFGVKYALCAPDSTGALPALFDSQAVQAAEIGGSTVAVYPNTAALPIGYTAQNQISRETYDALTPLQKQDALLDGVVLEETGLLPEAELTGDTVSPAAEMELDGVQQLDETTYYAPQDGGRITLTIAQPVADCETVFVVQGMQYTATSPLDAMSEEELSAISAHDRRSLQKQYAHFWRKDSVYLRLLSNIGEGRIEYNRPNSQYYCGRHDFVYNFGTSDEPLQQITIVLPFAGYYQFDRLAVECQKLDTVAARAENLGAENLQNVTLGTNSLGGEITTTRSSVLVVQLPYSTGWSVTVDGTPAQVLRADTAFLGVALEPGSHTVAFTYKTPGLTAGAALSAAGVVLLAAIWAVPALRKKSKKRRK